MFLSLKTRVQLHISTLSLFELFTDCLRAQTTSLSSNFSHRFGLRVILELSPLVNLWAILVLSPHFYLQVVLELSPQLNLWVFLKLRF